MPYLFQKLRKTSQNLSSAAVVIGVLRANKNFEITIQNKNISLGRIVHELNMFLVISNTPSTWYMCLIVYGIGYMIVGSFMAFADLIVPLPENHPKQT